MLGSQRVLEQIERVPAGLCSHRSEDKIPRPGLAARVLGRLPTSRHAWGPCGTDGPTGVRRSARGEIAHIDSAATDAGGHVCEVASFVAGLAGKLMTDGSNLSDVVDRGRGKWTNANDPSASCTEHEAVHPGVSCKRCSGG
jgi:hypothetical protein